MRPTLFTDPIPYTEARARILSAARPIERVELVAIAGADGRVSARDLASPIDVPAFDRAVMDGYAVIADDVAGASETKAVALRLTGEVFTGDAPGQTIAPGTCLAIATGAPLPRGATAVVMVERTRRDDGRVEVLVSVTPGQNIGRRGADMARGQVVLRAGDVLTPARLGSVAATGADALDVYVRPTVALLSTGNEIAAPGGSLPPGHVYDVNRFTVGAVVARHGGLPMPMRAAGDSIRELTDGLDQAATCDVIVFSGGSSVGTRDLMLDALAARGTIDIHGIAVKPGKPTLFGHVGGTPVFGMPGNPTSCLSNAYMLLVPFLRRVARLPEWQPHHLTVPLAQRVTSPIDRHQFYPVRIAAGVAHPVFKSSGDITSLADADGFIEIPEGVEAVDADDLVDVQLF